MLQKVKRPDGNEVSFEYDALGRRISKIGNKKITRYIWDGNVLLHEWSYDVEEEPKTFVDDEGNVVVEKEKFENVVTWVYEKDNYVPCVKIVDGQKFSIISDYLGRPFQSFDENSDLVWSSEYDVFGKIKNLHGGQCFIPFRQLGQYEDEDLDGLFYNRFRYYDNNCGLYLSQDPIKLASGQYNFYAYVDNPNCLVDIFGLSGIFTPSTWQAPTTGTGNNYHIYQQDIDWNKMDNKGRTNLQRASDGLAPIGKDGKSINLHHSNQKSKGPLFELSASTHTKYGHTNALHPYRVTPNADGSKNNPLDPVNREKFDIDRKQYWKDRAQAEIDARKLNYK